MSHEIRTNDSFGYVGRKAWHGLGRELAAGIDAETAFPKLGIGWKTDLLPIYCERLTEAGVERVEVPSHRLHVRADNGEQLGMVSDGYKPFENMDLARFADALAGSDSAVQIETAGTLYGNRRVFALVRLPQVVRATSEDVSTQYVLLSNGHGGTASFAVYPTSVRVVCANTLAYSSKDAARGVSFRHTGDFDEKLRMARKVLGTAAEEVKKFQEMVSALVRTDLSVGQAREFMEKAWTASFGKLDRLEDEALIRMRAKRDAEIEQWLGMMENERNSLPGIRGTAWAALNAVTEFHDHERGRFKSVHEGDGRVHSNLFGSSARAKSKVLKLALATVR